MANTYELITSSTVTASGGATSVTLSSIPSTYTDLLLKISARSAAATNQDAGLLEFSTITSGYTDKTLSGNGSGASSYGTVSGAASYLGDFDGASSTASTYTNTEIYIPNYSVSQYKSLSTDHVSENNATTAFAQLVAGLWSNNATISSIKFYFGLSGANVAQYSTFYLYGIKNS